MSSFWAFFWAFSLRLVRGLIAYPLRLVSCCLPAVVRGLVVPLNALLQHRGHTLLTAGRSIAVQNFNENLGVLGMVALYSWMISLDLKVQTVMSLLGVLIALYIVALMAWWQATGAGSTRIRKPVSSRLS